NVSLWRPRRCSAMGGGGETRRRPTSRSSGASCGNSSRIDFSPDATARTDTEGLVAGLKAWSPLSGGAGSSVVLDPVLVVVALTMARIDQLAAQQVQRRLVVEFEVVERIGEDLDRPHQTGFHVLDEEQLDYSKQEA